jgi:hypothetical protein
VVSAYLEGLRSTVLIVMHSEGVPPHLTAICFRWILIGVDFKAIRTDFLAG